MSGFKFPDEDTQATPINAEASAEGNEQAVEIEVVDDTPEMDKGSIPLSQPVEDPTDEELSSYSANVQAKINKLTHARHDERRAKEATLREKQELERLAQSLIEENKKLKQYVDTGTKQFVQQSQTLAESELEKARKQFKEAQESMDADQILAAQEALADARWKIASLKNYSPKPLQEESFEVQTQQSTNAAVKPDEKTLRWQAKNQWFGSDGFEEVTSFALGLHQKLVNSGVDPRSDAYFETIDSRVKTKFPEVFGEERSREGSKRQTSVVAPATRSSGVKKIQMTSTALALAKRFGLTPQQYAEQVAKLENQNG